MRRDNILTFAVLCVFHDWTFSVDSTEVNLPLQNPESNFPLNMAPDSVDDAYKGCENQMLHDVQANYLPKERYDNSAFNLAWMTAENQYKEKGTLSKIYSLAIHVYVDDIVYGSFNSATRTQKESYKTFQYHSLHFLLTNALRILEKKYFLRRFFKKRFHTFRGTGVAFHGDQNAEMRFGQFASSSFSKTVAKNFGHKSCFEIATYFGVPLGKYSQKPHEKEVLIPPYEVFKITKVMKKQDNKDLWCDVVYKLESTKKRKSDLNCQMVPLQRK